MQPVKLLVIDMEGKKPPQTATSFSADQYLLRTFPIYAADRQAVIEITERAARLLDQKPACGFADTLWAGHTRLIVKTACDEQLMVSARYTTDIDELRFSCDFSLIRDGDDLRKAQIRLLNFADYLSH